MRNRTFTVSALYHLSAGNKLSTSSSNSSRCACTSCCLTARRYRSDSLCLLSSTAICSQHTSQHCINIHCSDVEYQSRNQQSLACKLGGSSCKSGTPAQTTESAPHSVLVPSNFGLDSSVAMGLLATFGSCFYLNSPILLAC